MVVRPQVRQPDRKRSNRIQELFKRARKDLYYPPILKIELTEKQAVEVDLAAQKHKLLIGEGVADQYTEEALLGIFHHELNHWAKHPYDLKTIILEYSWLSDTAHKSEVRNFFDDVVVNLDLTINKGLEEIAQTYRELPLGDAADRLLRAFYTRVSGIDFGFRELDPDLEEKLSALRAIDFLDLNRVRIKNNIRRFAEIIDPLIDLGDQIGLPFTFFNQGDFRKDEIIRAMEGIAREVTPREYQRIAAEVLEEIKGNTLKLPSQRSGGKGITRGEEDLLQDLEKPDVSWYRSRARRYSIFIESLVRQGSLYPDQIMDFDLDDSIETYNPVESYGKVLPSLAKKHQLAEFERYGEYSVPDAVILMDSSGSMANPEEVVSYGVLGAFAVARNFFALGAQVGVINFSNSNLMLAPSRDRRTVYELLKTYQGGGTTLHLSELDQYMESVSGETIDYILITDAGIENVDRVIDYFSHIQGRLTVIWIKGEGDFDERFEENYDRLIKHLPTSVTFAEVAREQDIPRIAVGKMFGVRHEGN
jgi:hypothetical protein